MSITSLFMRFMAVMVAIAAVGCSTDKRKDRLIEEAMRQAGDNAAELQALLDRYDDDDEDRALAAYTVAAVWGRAARTGAGMDSIEALYRELPGVVQ